MTDSQSTGAEHDEGNSTPKRRAFAVVILALLALVAIVWINRRPATPPVEVNRTELTLRDGRLYRTGETNPFTGAMLEQYPGGPTKSRSEIVDGRLHGVSEGWFTNGVLQVREFFKEGVSHGLRTKWYENGAKLSEAEIVNGKLHGRFQRWHENGQLAEEITLIEDKPHGLSRAYHPSGYLKAEARLNHGEVVSQQFWEDGEKKADDPPDP